MLPTLGGQNRWILGEFFFFAFRAVIKRQGLWISPATINVVSVYFHGKNRRKTEPKEIPSCLIPCLLAVFIWQLEIVVTSLVIL